VPQVQILARSLVHAAGATGITIRVISGSRTYAQQDAIYLQRRAPLKEMNNAVFASGLDTIKEEDNKVRTKCHGG
jgi:D-alanyl-D-alanine carboxypeptidase